METLPKAITARYGLPDKLHELNRGLPLRLRVDGLHLEYKDGQGLVMNRRTGEIHGRYVQFNNDKFKLVKEKKS